MMDPSSGATVGAIACRPNEEDDGDDNNGSSTYDQMLKKKMKEGDADKQKKKKSSKKKKKKDKKKEKKDGASTSGKKSKGAGYEKEPSATGNMRKPSDVLSLLQEKQRAVGGSSSSRAATRQVSEPEISVGGGGGGTASKLSAGPPMTKLRSPTAVSVPGPTSSRDFDGSSSSSLSDVERGEMPAPATTTKAASAADDGPTILEAQLVDDEMVGQQTLVDVEERLRKQILSETVEAEVVVAAVPEQHAGHDGDRRRKNGGFFSNISKRTWFVVAVAVVLVVAVVVGTVVATQKQGPATDTGGNNQTETSQVSAGQPASGANDAVTGTPDPSVTEVTSDPAASSSVPTTVPVPIMITPPPQIATPPPPPPPSQAPTPTQPFTFPLVNPVIRECVATNSFSGQPCVRTFQELASEISMLHEYNNVLAICGDAEPIVMESAIVIKDPGITLCCQIPGNCIMRSSGTDRNLVVSGDSVTLSGISFEDGTALNEGDPDGGNVAILSGGDHVVSNCVFREGTSRSKGANLYFERGDSVTIVDSSFYNGTSQLHSGGGVFFQYPTNVFIKDSIFVGNRDAGGGGAIGIVQRDLPTPGQIFSFTGCTFLDNRSARGAGFHGDVVGRVPEFLNLEVRSCVFERNQASYGAGAGSIYFNADASNWNVQLSNNSGADNNLNVDPAVCPDFFFYYYDNGNTGSCIGLSETYP